MSTQYIPFRPLLHGPFATRFYENALELSKISALSDVENLVAEEIRWVTEEFKINPRQRSIYRASWLLLRDLIRVGWDYRWNLGTLEVAPPSGIQEVTGNQELKRVKALLRDAMGEVRRERIAEAREFILRMEKPSPNGVACVPITALIADAQSLAEDMRRIQGLPDEDSKLNALRQSIKPYLQLVNENERCSQTGHKLSDIWRYFRFTWATPSESTPGRSMQYLIRDAARPHHPVMGLASLGNMPLRIESRDYEFGWTPEAFRDQISKCSDEESLKASFQSLITNIETAIKDISLEGLCTAEECSNPNQRVLQRLSEIAIRSAAEREVALREWWNREEDEENEIIERSDLGNISKAAEEALYKRKRAEQLYRLLSARKNLQELLLNEDLSNSWRQFVESESGNSSIRAALIASKSRHIGTSMLELNICGAIPPYNELLAGKLTALVMLSPQVVEDYKQRYGERPSDIASRLKGEPVIRPADLIYIGTTSLYSVGSSQYNRLKLPNGLLKPNGLEVRWRQIGVTKGYGTLHISKLTAQCLEEAASDGYSSVNHVFGEGSSPKMRAIRKGLEAVFGSGQRNGINELSKHAMSRLVYGAWLISNGYEYLHGKSTKPEYYFDDSLPVKEATEVIVDYWRRRWLLTRLAHDEALNKVETFNKYQILVSQDLPLTESTRFSSIMEEDTIMPTNSLTTNDALYDYVGNLYRGPSAYADQIDSDLLEAIHVETPLDEALLGAVASGKHVVLTGNPGDGKTHIIRMLRSRLDALPVDIVVELDASTLHDDKLYNRWKSAHDEGKLYCVAINEAVLFKLAESYPDFLPLKEARNQVVHSVVYSDFQPEASTVVVFDLSRRNILSSDVVNKVLDKLTNPQAAACENCPHYEGCDFTRHRQLLCSEQFRNRLQTLFDRVSRRGFHATLRELQSFVSYLLFGNRSCQELIQTSGEQRYGLPMLVFKGEGKLFDALRDTFDPAEISHPVWDDALVYAETSPSDWLTGWSVETEAIDHANLNRFKARKRAFYFCHSSGSDLQRIAGDDESEFARFLEAPDREILRIVIRGINRFFGDANANDELRVWQSHRYNNAARRVFYSAIVLRRRYFEIVRPRLLTTMASGFDLALDHVLLRLRNRPQAKLRVDFNMFQLLMQAERGLPVMLLENDVTRRLWQFMERLTEPFYSESCEEEEIMLLDSATSQRLTITIDVINHQYLTIRKD